MLTLIAFPLVILLAAVLLGFLFALLSKRSHPNDRLSVSGVSELPASLRQAVDGDAAKLIALIEHERRLDPASSELDLELRAYQRLRRERGNN